MLSFYRSDTMLIPIKKRKRIGKSNIALMKHQHGWADGYTKTAGRSGSLILFGGLIVIVLALYCFFTWYFWIFQSCCKIKWVIENKTCYAIQNAIMEQIEDWSFEDPCWGENDEGCKYEILESSDGTLLAQHTIKYAAGTDIQDLTFLFTQERNNCTVLASAMSRPNMATLRVDDGGNYCALRDLVEGVGGGAIAVVESFEPRECRQRDNADCIFVSSDQRPRIQVAEYELRVKEAQGGDAREGNVFIASSSQPT